MDGRKLRRVLAKVGLQVAKNCIVALQETHKIDDRLLKLYWKHNFIPNCNHNNKNKNKNKSFILSQMNITK